MLKKSMVCSTLLLITNLCIAEDGRYQAFPIPPSLTSGSDKVFIIDTNTGDLWTWTESPTIGEYSGGRYLQYQGRVKPGDKIGEMIDKEIFK